MDTSSLKTESANRAEPGDSTKATSGLARLVIHGHAGFITFDAQLWLHDAKASLVHIDTDGTVLAAIGRTLNNPALRRAQALAATNERGVEVSRHLLTLKVSGQKRIANSLGFDLSEPVEPPTQPLNIVRCWVGFLPFTTRRMKERRIRQVPHAAGP